MADELEYDRKQWVKRALAFEHVIFPSAARRIVLQRHHGYNTEARETFAQVIRVLRPFQIKVMEAEHAKAYFILACAFRKFLARVGYDAECEDWAIRCLCSPTI